MKRKLFIITIAMTILAGFSGCMSKEEKEKAKEYEKQAEENAVEYIKEKYDIDADVVEASFNKSGMFGEVASSYVDVKMEYDDKEFDVYVRGDKAWDDLDEDGKKLFGDNYQYDEIYNDMKDYLKDQTDVNIEELSVWYNDVEESSLEHITTLYYDGDIQKFMEEQYVSVVLVTTDEKVGEFSTVDMESGELHVYSYEEKYYNKNGNNIKYDWEHKYALWLNWSADVKKDQDEVVEYEKQEFDLGYIVYSDECEFDVIDTVVDEQGWEDSGFKKAEVVSNAYKIYGDEEDVYIFIESFDNDDNSIGIVYEKNSDDEYEKVISYEGEYCSGVLDMKKYGGEVSVVILED
ncbi:MAG: hypothetical protein J6L69_07335 [Lachnospiraceae bacterium]|nr:hypothetical protein [Lachnospiraceae bacterium]